jgi:hypothetical protein
MNIYSTSMCSCIICKEEHSIKGIGSHYIRKHTNQSLRNHGKGTQKFQLRCSCLECHQEVSVQNIQAHYTSCTKSIINKCTNCFSSCSNKFCSHSCAATYNNKQRDTFKSGPSKFCGSKLLRMFNKKPKQQQAPYTKISFCVVCGNVVTGKRKSCSSSCKHELFVRGGKKSASQLIRRSKDEIALYELCAAHFNNVTSNNPIFNGWDADILIHDNKIAILWNGPWHYKQLNIKNHSLKQVQNRDQIKQKEIESAGWTCIIFEDRYYTPESAFKVLSSDPWIRTRNDEL